MKKKPAKARKKLNPRQAAYLRNRKQLKTQKASALAAGYSAKRAYVIGAELERRIPEIREQILDAVTKAMSADDALKRMAKLGRAAKAERTKYDAILTFLRMHGLLKERHEHTGPGGGAIPVQVYIPENGRRT